MARGRAVVQALGQLERALDVLARGLPVALAAAAAGAPREHARAQQVARQPERSASLSASSNSDDRGRDAREVVAAGAEPEEHVGALDVRERRPLDERARPARSIFERRAGSRRSACRPSPRRSAAAPRARASRRRGRRRAARSNSVDRLVRTRGASVSASARASVASTRARSSAETPLARKLGSTPSRAASHSIVSCVGRVLPRSICETYSFEKRSPASSLCVSPEATRSWRRRSPRRDPRWRRRASAAVRVTCGVVTARSQTDTSPKRKSPGGQITRKGHEPGNFRSSRCE